MSDITRIQLAQRGLLTLPKELRDTYNLKPGDEMSLLDLGGVFILSPRHSQVDHLADNLRAAISERGESLESVLNELREMRQGHAS